MVAPAGYGKTTLAEQWYRACPAGTAGWLSVDLLDGRPSVFWDHLLAALAGTAAPIDDEPVALLHERGADDPLFLLSLCNQLLAHDGCISLVLDDLDRVDDPQVLAGVQFLIERTAGHLRVLITGRTEPALPFPRWLAAGRLSEIRRDDLRFGEGEAQELVASFGTALLSEDEVRDVNERVEGWPAGLQLAMLVVSTADSPGDAARRVAGNDELIAGYFTSEVLPSLTDRQRATALAMSVPRWFDLDLCRALAGDEAVRVIHELRERGLFLSTLDRPDRFRFHALFRQLLEDQLRWSDPALHEKLHRRTAAVLLERGDHLGTYRHLLAVGDVDAAVRAATAPAIALFDRGQAPELSVALRALPDDLDVSDADDATNLAVAYMLAVDRVAAARWLDRAAQLHTPDDPVRGLRIALGQLVVATAGGDDEGARRALAQGDELRPHAADPAGFGGRFEGMAARFTVVAGEPDAAERITALRAVTETTPMTEVLAPAIEAVLLIQTGDLAAAAPLAATALARGEERLVDEHPAVLDALIAAGGVASGRGELTRAAGLLERVRGTSIPLFTWYAVRAGTLYADVVRLLEGGPAALAVVDELRARSEQPVRGHSLGRMLDRAWASALIACGRLDAADRVLATLPDTPADIVMRARATLAADDHDRVAVVLGETDRWPAQARIEADVLRALAATGGAAEAAMRRALELGDRTTWVLPFLGHGPSSTASPDASRSPTCIPRSPSTSPPTHPIGAASDRRSRRSPSASASCSRSCRPTSPTPRSASRCTCRSTRSRPTSRSSTASCTCRRAPKPSTCRAAPDRPNILIIWGDDIGISNLSCYSDGLMGYRTPNIDRIAHEGARFTDYYGEQSCTAGRAAFISGQNPYRTGLTKVGMPGAPIGYQQEDPTIATALKAQGYATGQFGKNHFGDRDEFLPTANGFDEFFGNLYHLNAEEEPEEPDYPTDEEFPNFRARFGPRGVIRSWANEDGTQRIEDTGPLTRERMKTCDEEFRDAAVDFMRRQTEADTPFFVWFNTTHMHFRTHTREEDIGRAGRWQSTYHDTMVYHDEIVGQVLDELDALGIADNTIVMYSTDNGPHMNTWPDAGMTPFRNEKNSNWEGAYRVPCVVRWPGRIEAGTVLNGIVSHNDWFVTLLAAAGNPDIAEQLREGADLNGTTYKVHLDGHNQLDYLTGATDESPRRHFFYVTDEGDLAALRFDNWKIMFLENRAPGTLQVWIEPFTELRTPKVFNLRTDPYERADITSNTYYDWMISHAWLFVPAQMYVAEMLTTLVEFPPRQEPASFSIDRVMAKLRAGMGSD